MMSVRVYEEGQETCEVESARISEVLRDKTGLVWVDLAEPSEDDLACLQKEFSLHPLAMDDVRAHHQRPKLEQYPTHSFLVAYSNEMQEVDFFVGPSWQITFRECKRVEDAWSVDGARTRFERTRAESVSAGFLLYVLLDELVDGYFQRTDRVEDHLEELEEHIFGEELREERDVQERMFDVRRELMEFRRVVVPLRDVVGSLQRREVEWVDEATAVHLQDVYDHVLRVVDLLDSQRELLGNAVDAHLAIISNRMNGVMKKMTSWGAILLGATLVAGIYGMNFEHMPELKWRLGYLWALGIMAMITVLGYRYFSRKDWL